MTQGEKSGNKIGGQCKEQRREHDCQQAPACVNSPGYDSKAHEHRYRDDVVCSADALLATQDFRENAQRKCQTNSGEECDQYDAVLSMICLRNAECAHDLISSERHRGSHDCGDPKVKKQDRAQHLTELVPLTADRKFGDTFLRGKTKTKIQ